MEKRLKDIEYLLELAVRWSVKAFLAFLALLVFLAFVSAVIS